MINLKTLFQLEQLDSSSVSKLKISFSRGQTLCVDSMFSPPQLPVCLSGRTLIGKTKPRTISEAGDAIYRGRRKRGGKEGKGLVRKRARRVRHNKLHHGVCRSGMRQKLSRSGMRGK